MPNAPRRELEREELDLIQQVVRDFLSTRTESPGFEFDDLLQEASLHWWRQQHRFDERRGATKSTYLRRVVTATLRDIERDRKAKKRGGRKQPLSLDAQIDADISRPEPGDPRTANLDWPPAVERAMSRLKARERTVVRGLGAGFNKSELSRRLNISRETLHRDLARIREVFRDEGLDRYLR